MEKNVQTNEKHKIKLSSEATYVAAIILLSFAVAILSAADFGISMIVAPAYLLSLKTGVLTFGQAEYVIQAGLVVVLCVILRKFRFVYLFSFCGLGFVARRKFLRLRKRRAILLGAS